ncbi:hypothetical protein CFSAN001628_008988 [Clostridium botulinum CFSAN001628]|nr:hypothetical protein CFSAN001628_008988 [Clostridium botulinum CFSAN001628]
MQDYIEIKGAKEHNLKNISVSWTKQLSAATLSSRAQKAEHGAFLL